MSPWICARTWEYTQAWTAKAPIRPKQRVYPITYVNDIRTNANNVVGTYQGLLTDKVRQYQGLRESCARSYSTYELIFSIKFLNALSQLMVWVWVFADDRLFVYEGYPWAMTFKSSRSCVIGNISTAALDWFRGCVEYQSIKRSQSRPSSRDDTFPRRTETGRPGNLVWVFAVAKMTRCTDAADLRWLHSNNIDRCNLKIYWTWEYERAILIYRTLTGGQ